MKAITAYAFGRELGRILKELRQNERFVVLCHNRPVGIFLGIEDYVREHPDEYEDVEDFLNTLLEEGDREFQHSLRRGAGEVKRGLYLSRGEAFLDELEHKPTFRGIMASSAKDIRAGRLHSQADAERVVRRGRRR